MIKSDTKYLIDGFCRSILLDWLSKSSYSKNLKIKNYIIHEATYNNVLKLVYTKRPLKEDASSDMKLSEYEQMLGNLFGIGISIFASGPLHKYVNSLLQKGFKIEKIQAPVKGIFSKKPIEDINGNPFIGTKMIAKRGGKLGTAFVRTATPMTPVLSFMGIMTGINLLTKVLFAILKKIISKCTKDCKKSIPKKIKNYNVKLQICISKCKIQDLNKVITNLKKEVAKCKQVSENPEKCQINIIKQISKFNDHLMKEKIRLNNSLKIM